MRQKAVLGGLSLERAILCIAVEVQLFLLSLHLGKGTELGSLGITCSGCWARGMNSSMQGPTKENFQPEEENFSTFVAGLVSRGWQKVVVALDKERPSDKEVNSMGATFCSYTLPNEPSSFPSHCHPEFSSNFLPSAFIAKGAPGLPSLWSRAASDKKKHAALALERHSASLATRSGGDDWGTWHTSVLLLLFCVPSANSFARLINYSQQLHFLCACLFG